MLGVLFALISTASFSLNSVMVRRGVASASASAGAFVTVLIGVPMFAVAALVSGQLFRAAELPGTGYILLSAAGIMHFGIGRYCNYRAVSAIGATRVAPIQSFAIPYAVFIAFVFLGETINWGMAVGIGLILVGPAIMIERASTPAPKPRDGHRARFRASAGRRLSVRAALHRRLRHQPTPDTRGARRPRQHGRLRRARRLLRRGHCLDPHAGDPGAP